MFYDIKYDPRRESYLISYLKGIQHENKDGTRNVFAEKPKYFIVFDKDFKIKRKFAGRSFRNKYGVIFPAPHGFFLFRRNLNDKLKFYYYEFDIERNQSTTNGFIRIFGM